MLKLNSERERKKKNLWEPARIVHTLKKIQATINKMHNIIILDTLSFSHIYDPYRHIQYV